MNLHRDVSIDIAKGISMIAIVMGHIGFMYPEFFLVNTRDLFIYLWHVPVFFLLSGFFIKEEQLRQPILFFKKKFVALYLKMLYFYIPAVLLHNVLLSWGWYSLESTSPVIHQYSSIDFVKQLFLTLCMGGREPIMGAMWFVIVLFMALIGLSIISWMTNKIVKNGSKYEWLRFIVILLLCMVVGILSNKYGLTIRRFSNVFTAILLIYLGKVLFQRIKLRFDNVYLCIVCALITFEVASMMGGVSLNGNEYKDILQLSVASSCALYVIIFIGRQIQHSLLGKCLAKVGNESFYVMALHFAGFKLCSMILNTTGMGGDLYDLTPDIGKNLFLLLLIYFIWSWFSSSFYDAFQTFQKAFFKNIVIEDI